MKIAEWNPGSSALIHRQHHQNDCVFDGAGEPFGAGTIIALNHIQITNAKPRDKAYKVADSDGLYLVVQTNGAKLWRKNYRLGRQKTLYFGAWPEVGIAAARQQRDKAREQIAAGSTFGAGATTVSFMSACLSATGWKRYTIHS